MRVCTFQMSEKIPDSTNVAFEAPFSHPSPLGAKYIEKLLKNAGFSPQGPYSSQGRRACVQIEGKAVNKSAASAASLDGFSSRD